MTSTKNTSDPNTQKSPIDDHQKIAMQVSFSSIILNMALSIFKLLAGIIGHSGAMISDAVHSASDVFSTIIVIIGVNISGKAADKEHPYGHERMESMASVILAIILALTGGGIGYAGLRKTIAGDFGELAVPGMLALMAAIISIIVKEGMYQYTRIAAKKINSDALMADAWHHRSDALSSVGAFVGILGARLGFPVLDPIASLVICVFIEKAAFDIYRSAFDKMVDRACPEEQVAKIREIILQQEGVITLDDLKTRQFGPKIYVDVEIGVQGSKTLWEAHKIAAHVHDAIETQIPEVKHCMVHENPKQG